MALQALKTEFWSQEMFVPVVDKNNRPLMPTKIRRAKRWVASGKATFFWKTHMLCVRLNVEPSDDKKQPIALGIDPGSKREGYTVKSKAHTYANPLSSTVDWVKKAMEVRRNMRRARRWRNCKRRPERFDNRHRSRLPPSTKARWQLKLNVCKKLLKLYAITDFIIEDIKARTHKGIDKRNVSFSPLEVGKKWFYAEISKLGNLIVKQGYETKELRDLSGLKKISNKLSSSFYSHNIDSWVLSNSVVGGHTVPENERVILITPLQFHRRQLHAFQPDVGGKRRPYGGTKSLDFKRGSLVKHKKYGVVYVGGTMGDKISVHDIRTGKRISQNVKICDCKFLAFNSIRVNAIVSSTGVETP